MAADSIPVNAPVITAAARDYVNQTLDAGWLSSAGPMVERFERAFAQAIGVRHLAFRWFRTDACRTGRCPHAANASGCD